MKWMPALLVTVLLLAGVAGCSSTQTVTSTLTNTNYVTNTVITTATPPTATQTVTGTVTNTVITTATPTPKPPDTTSVTLQFIAASSLSGVLNELNAAYIATHPWVTIKANITGGSGTLETQIKEGLEGDLFLSAAMSNMDNLQNLNLIVDNSRKTLLNNNLVLITRTDSTLSINGFTDLTKLTSSQVLAIADPGSAPVGVYAMEALEHYGIKDSIKASFSLQSNTTQVLQAVKNGAADAGIVYMTDALSEKDSIKVVETAPAEVNAKIKYPVAVLKSSKNQAAAEEYIDFLFSAEARVIFEKYGFAIAG
jgi:molybdate transport system substrate-binding protein